MNTEEKQAAETVERLLRQYGKCVQVTITPRLVELADTSWAGSYTAKTLADALADAEKYENES